MLNLFSSFDPNCISIPINLFIMFLVVFLFPNFYWMLSSQYLFILSEVFNYLKKEFILLINKNLFGGTLIYISLFFFILQFNFYGMFPYSFTMTSQVNMNLYFSLVFFFIFFVLGWVNLSKIMFAHLTPMGSPMILSPILVLIELISLIIRPFTLSIRLTANIVSGHILMEIILNPSNEFMFILKIIYFFIILPIFCLELMVCFVQAFVISSLSSLYLGEPLSH